jgi:hypothetical protein
MGRPDFANVRALHKHFNLALAKLDCPQSLVYGWTGMAMDPVMYSLIKPNPFVTPNDPGLMPTYNAGFQATQQMKTMEQLWDNDRNYFLSYVNVHRACFRLLDELIHPEYKVSNQPGLSGWNSTMLIQSILAQLEVTFGKPTAAITFNNNTMFMSGFSVMDTPKRYSAGLKSVRNCGVGRGPVLSATDRRKHDVSVLTVGHLPASGVRNVGCGA